MAKTILGEYTLIQNGNPLDRTAVAVETFETPAKLSLSVSIAAETLEGESDRVHPAQISTHAAMEYLKQSTATDPHTLILEAFRAANRELYELGRNVHERLSCSMALAVLVDDHMLYVGNLGATRIYLYDPQAGLQQLSVEHTFAQIMTQQRQMSYEQAIAHSKAATILRSLGTNDDVEADTGFYGLSGNSDNGQQFGLRGFPIQAGEAVVVCTSAFYKTSAVTNEPSITEAEIIRTLETRSGVDAARIMVEYAIPRQPEDFIAAALLQLPARRQSSRVARPSSQGMVLWLVVLVMLVGFGALFLFPRLSQRPEPPAPTNTDAVQVAQVSTSVTESPTIPPPTATDFPTPAPTNSAIGLVSVLGNSSSNPNPLLQGHVIDAPADTGLRVDIPNGNEAIASAQLYMQPLTQVQIEQVTPSQVLATLYKGGDIFINSGGYRDGVIVRLSDAENISFSVSGSYMSVHYSPELITVTCFEGNCAYIVAGPPPYTQTIPVGQTAYITPNGETTFEPVTGDQVEHYRTLANSNGADEDVNAFLADFISPTPVATDDLQNTEEATSEATATSSETNTRVPATRTPTGTRTMTVTPTSTSTSQPTATNQSSNPSHPATNTPVPLTRTPTYTATTVNQPTDTDTATTAPQPTDTDTATTAPQPTDTDTATTAPQPTDTDTATTAPQPTDTPTDPPQPTDTPTNPPQPTDTATNVPPPPDTPTDAPPPTDNPPATEGS